MENTLAKKAHTFSFHVANKPGVLIRIAQVFARRGYNIDSLVVSSGVTGDYSRMTITAEGDPETLEQIVKQCAKLVDVLHATEHIGADVIQKEMALIKVRVDITNRTEILQLCEHFKAQTIDFTEESLVIQVTGNTDKLDAMMSMFGRYEVLEVVRSGKMVMARGTDQT